MDFRTLASRPTDSARAYERCRSIACKTFGTTLIVTAVFMAFACSLQWVSIPDSLATHTVALRDVQEPGKIAQNSFAWTKPTELESLLDYNETKYYLDGLKRKHAREEKINVPYYYHCTKKATIAQKILKTEQISCAFAQVKEGAWFGVQPVYSYGLYCFSISADFKARRTPQKVQTSDSDWIGFQENINLQLQDRKKNILSFLAVPRNKIKSITEMTKEVCDILPLSVCLKVNALVATVCGQKLRH